jgi:mono/diheme cytochrome c family protein
MRHSILVSAFLTLAAHAADTNAPARFDQLVKPMFTKSCMGCHNERLASGSLNLAPYTAQNSLVEGRDGWERILQKVRSGEMPPKGLPRPSVAEVKTLVDYINGEFEKADRLVKPDPGRVTARRLNRNEYSNTIRDLLAVDFRAERDFPSDDSGHGFDNIGDVLTISPILMEKYLRAAERIAARAIGADPLPKKPVDAEYHSKEKAIRRIDRSTIEATHRIDWDGEYIVRIGFPGERSADSPPVKFGFWMDGKLLHTMSVETKPSKLVYFDPYSEEEFRLVLPEGDHVFRAGFIDDGFVKTLSEKDAYSNKKNKFLNMIKFVGPFPAKVEKASRKKILICDPNTGGNACIDQIMTKLAHRAFRRPVTKAEVAGLTRFVGMAKADGQSVEQGLQLAIQAMLVSPHFLFRVERDPVAEPGKAHPVSEIELASRLSYFLWSSMPDDELLGLAEAGKLRAGIEAQVKRMLTDPKAAAFAANFAGQWLETRNLDSVKPDPGKFPEWGPELRDAMKMETNLFFEHMLRENRPLSDFLNARYTFLNERLAKHYGIDGVTGGDFRRVDLATEQRGGVLSHASVLTVSSYPTRTSPVIRGKYILQNVLGAPPPAPPPDVPTLNEEAVGTSASLRKQMEQHRSNATCASCHNRMDTLGFGLENYDGIGRWRTQDGKFPIDVSGAFPNGKSFDTPAKMRDLLTDDLPDFARCLTEKMMTYALGRGLEKYDRRTIESINKKLATENYPFQSMVFEIVRSLPFQSRRGEAAAPVKSSSETAKLR